MGMRSKDQWIERSKAWTKTVAPGISADDTFNKMIIAETGILPGEKLLDLASGTGNPAISIAYSMNEIGEVFCTDLTEKMLNSARQRAKNLDLDIVKFIAADMGSLPFTDNIFDVITCRFGVMFSEDKVSVALESHRTLKKGGRAAYIVWGSYEENPPFHIPRREVYSYLGIEEGPTPERHSMSAPGDLEEMLTGGNFSRVEERELRYTNPIEDIKDYVTRNLNRSFSKETEDMTEADFCDLRQAVIKAWKPFIKNGILLVPNYARLGLGWKTS